MSEESKIYYQLNKERMKITQKKYNSKNPWLSHLNNARTRCNSKNVNWRTHKYYAGKGIKCELTTDEIKMLWKKYRAHKLIKPSLDRKNSNENYTFENCRFIEMGENSSRINSVGYKLRMKLKREMDKWIKKEKISLAQS